SRFAWRGNKRRHVARRDASTMNDPQPLTLDVNVAPDGAMVRCRGKLTSVASGTFHREVKRLIPQTARITVDLTDVTFMDSMGLGTIGTLHVSANSSSWQLQLHSLSLT